MRGALSKRREADSLRSAGQQLTNDARTSALLDRLDEIEARLDPEAHRNGRVIADLITVSVCAPLAVFFDWHASRPFLLFGLMVAGLVLNRLIPVVNGYALRRERDQLCDERLELDGDVDHGTA